MCNKNAEAEFDVSLDNRNQDTRLADTYKVEWRYGNGVELGRIRRATNKKMTEHTEWLVYTATSDEELRKFLETNGFKDTVDFSEIPDEMTGYFEIHWVDSEGNPKTSLRRYFIIHKREI